ncbi:uncharacterized protein LOC134336758 isoform X4 [Mobula hypostoma]|uniref:uncharacterized protein LOC134336758 isoform X4 n=1 Tax=Mobula hypostoma TaxID=723540 RepID=UPI002FC38B18
MAFMCSGQSVILHRGRDAGDWTRRFMVGGGRRNNSGSTKADVRQGLVGRSETSGRRGPPGARRVGDAPRPCSPAPGHGAPNRAVAVGSEPRLPLLPVRSSARWGAAKFGGRAVGRISQILAVLPFYSPVAKPDLHSTMIHPAILSCQGCGFQIICQLIFNKLPTRGDD